MRLCLTAMAASVALACAAGCSDPPDTLTCDWLQGPTNCWKATGVMATTCLPPDSERGTFNADGSTCSYANGTVVSFTPALALPLPTSADMKWNFTVSNPAGPQPCLHYVDAGSGVTLTVGSQTVTEGGGGFGLSIACPDGTKVQTANALDLFNCPDGGLTDLPGLVWSSTPASSGPPYFVSAGLIGTGDSSIPIFDCTTP